MGAVSALHTRCLTRLSPLLVLESVSHNQRRPAHTHGLMWLMLGQHQLTCWRVQRSRVVQRNMKLPPSSNNTPVMGRGAGSPPHDPGTWSPGRQVRHSLTCKI